MIRLTPSICMFCQVTSLLRPRQWQQQVRFAHAQRKRPSRMVLSNKVSKSGPGGVSSGSFGAREPERGVHESRGKGRFRAPERGRRNDGPIERFGTKREGGPSRGSGMQRRGDQGSSVRSTREDREHPPLRTRDNEWRPREKDGHSTPRKERRAAYYKDVVQEHERNRAEQAEDRFGRGPPREQKDYESSYPLWAPRPDRPEKKKAPREPGITTDRPRPGPFGALNQRQVRLPTVRSTSWSQGAAAKREGGRRDAYARDKPSDKDKDKDKNKGARKDGDYHALKMQQALATVGYGSRNAIKDKISDVESFEDFPLLETLQEAIPSDALQGMTNVVPTPIQALAIPALMGAGEGRRRNREPAVGMQQFLLAAETGSGKTMAYLLPAIDAMKRAEQAEKRREEIEAETKRKAEEETEKGSMFAVDPPEEAEESAAGRPRVIILVPTAELVEQVGQLAKAISHQVKFRAAFVSSNYSGTVIRNRLFSEIDVLVSTPHLLGSVADSEPNILSRVSHLIIDEADSLFDRSFSPITSKIIDKATPSLKQLVLCSATIPKRLDNYLRERFPDIKRLTTPNLHAIPRRVQLGVVDVDKDPYRGNKDLACADIIWKIGSSAAEHGDNEPVERTPTKRLIVFVNEREKSVELAEYLVTKGIDAVALNRDMDTRNQTALLAQFTSLAAPLQEKAEGSVLIRKTTKKTQRVLPNTKVLVCTDIASRGIDTTAVRHVVLYDVPHTSIDFIHRLGRTGRMGRRGRGVVLVGKGDRRDVVKEIREAMFKGAALI